MIYFNTYKPNHKQQCKNSFQSYFSYFTEGPIVCETVYETECQTSYHLHEVEEDVPKCETQMVCTNSGLLLNWKHKIVPNPLLISI